MDADVRLADGTVLHLQDVEVQARTLTATVDGRRVSLPTDRWLAQKVLMACPAAQAKIATAAAAAPSAVHRASIGTE